MLFFQEENFLYIKGTEVNDAWALGKQAWELGHTYGYLNHSEEKCHLSFHLLILIDEYYKEWN